VRGQYRGGVAEDGRCARRIHQDAADRLGCPRQVIPHHEDRRVTANLPRDWSVQNDWRYPRGQRLERRQPEPFVLREKDEYRCPRVKVGKRIGADVAEKLSLVTDAPRSRHAAEILPRPRTIVSHDDEPGGRDVTGGSRKGGDHVRKPPAVE